MTQIPAPTTPHTTTGATTTGTTTGTRTKIAPPTPAGLSLPSAGSDIAVQRGRRGPDRPAAPRQLVPGGWWGWWRGDRGSVASEVTLLAPFLILLLVFVAVFIHRGVEVRLRLDDAAHQAARAASLQRSAGAATAAAQATAEAALAPSGVMSGATCAGLTTDTATAAMRPGGTVTVTLTCTVDLADATVLGVPGQIRLLATATEPVDTYRSVETTATSPGNPGDTG